MIEVKDIEELIGKLVSPYSIVNEIRKISLKPYDLPLHAYAGRVGLVENRCKSSLIPWVSGVGFVEEDALNSVLGEAVERYGWCSPSRNKIVLAAEAKLRRAFCPVEDACFIFRKDLLKDEVLAKLRHIEIPWLPAKSLANSKEVLMPAIDLFQDFLPSEVRNWILSTTNGIAADSIFERACLHAIYEVVERDATMRMWYQRKSPNKPLDLDGHHQEVNKLIEKAKILGLHISVLDITTDVRIPCAFAYVYYEHPGSECLACGSASGLKSQQAATKALLEASAMWNSLGDLKTHARPMSPREPLLGFPKVSNFEDHVLLYTCSWARKGYEFLLSRTIRKREKITENKFQSKSVRKELSTVVNLLKAKGYEVFIIDITPDDIKGLGLHVVKAVVPGLVPLFVGKYKAFFSRRLSEKAILNQWPHPFP
jgi:thiazole/oxazole-forming peptide maturase SagD family component